MECHGCKQDLPPEAFHRDKSKKRGRQGKCKKCQYARYLERLEADPERVRAINRASQQRHRLKYLYGLAQAQFDDLAAAQDHRCLICGEIPKPREGTTGGLVVDHDHETGRVRGLLCHNCNRGLGLLGDRIVALESAVLYLATHSLASLAGRMSSNNEKEIPMSRPAASEEDKVIETWEAVVDGTVWVWVYDRRDDRYTKAVVGGNSASRRLHITRDDRKWNQEQIPFENQKHDPFTNGALRLVASATRDETLDVRYHYTGEELAQFFEIRDHELFQEAITAIESELILRRLLALAEGDATLAQVEAIRELLQERWPIGGTQRTVREMFAESERLGLSMI